MNVLSRLWRAVAGLAESVEALAGTVGEANSRLRQQLALGPSEVPAPALPGGVIDQPGGAEAAPPARRNGRRATA